MVHSFFGKLCCINKGIQLDKLNCLIGYFHSSIDHYHLAAECSVEMMHSTSFSQKF